MPDELDPNLDAEETVEGADGLVDDASDPLDPPATGEGEDGDEMN